MNKIFATILLVLIGNALSAQFMIIGNDSISLADFKKEYKFGLENNGVEKTLSSTQDFLLLQQFAAEKKADTTMAFREKMGGRERELRKEFFYPKEIIDPVLNEYMKDNRTEKKVQLFMVRKTDDDTNNYLQIYNDVKAGKISIDSAIAKYAKTDPTPVYIKPGSVDYRLYDEIKSLPDNSFTKFRDASSYVVFAKVLASRPSLGYMIFGTISFPKDANSESMKTKIYTDLKAGKTFQEVAKLYGANEREKESGGLILGSPTLPENVYELLKGKKAGYYTPEPVLYGDNYFIFNVYNVEPYELTAKNRDFFLQDMTNSLYGEKLQDKMVEYLKKDPSFKEFPIFSQVKKSYRDFEQAKDDAVVYQYKNHKTTVGDIKKLLTDKKAEAEKSTPAFWNDALSGLQSQDILRFYSMDFTNQKAIKKDMNEFKKGLYSDYVFSKYLTEEIAKHPEWLTEYYNKNKAKFMWGNRAEGRVAIIADEKLVPEIAKKIKDPKNWEPLKKEYYGKLNDQKQILVHFESGEMEENADVFTKYKVPFAPGVHQTKMEARLLVIAIDKILPPSQMTQAEAAEMLKDAVTEQKLREIIATQKAKTKIIVEPEFKKDLEANFKK